MHQIKHTESRRIHAASSEDRLLEDAERRLQANDPAGALERLGKASLPSQLHKNAIGVCHLRLNDPRAALHVFQSLAMDGGFLRMDVPAVFRLNLAVARLLSGNIIGFEAALRSVSSAECPSVEKYRTIYRDWRKSLSLGERLRFAFTRETDHAPQLNFPPGELR